MEGGKPRPVWLVTPTGEEVAWVDLPADAPRGRPFVVEWEGRYFVRCGERHYMEVARVVATTRAAGGSA